MMESIIVIIINIITIIHEDTQEAMPPPPDSDWFCWKVHPNRDMAAQLHLALT